jgi:hypothetical protein
MRPPAGEELAAIAAAYLRLSAHSAAPPAPTSRWRLAARSLDADTDADAAFDVRRARRRPDAGRP